MLPLLAAGAAGIRSRSALLDADATYRGAVLDAVPVTTALRLWSNDPASADRVGRTRLGGIMGLHDVNFADAFTFTRASSATDYGATGLLASVATDAIRMGYDPVTLAPVGWRLEGARTNLLLYSQQMDNAAWLKSSTSVTADSTVEPSGNTTADTLIEASGTALHFAKQSIVKAASALTYTFSAYVKSFSANREIILNITENGIGYALIRFNPSTGVVTQAATADGTHMSSASGGSIALPNGWYRLWVTATTATDTTLAVYLSLYNAATSYAGDGASGVYVWGAQVEQANTLSSYIATTSASATRATDAHAVAGSVFTGLFGTGAPQGTLVFDITPGQAAPTGINQIITQLDDGTDANRTALYNQAGTLDVKGFVVLAGVLAGPTASAGTMVAGTTCRVGLRWGGGAIAVCMNGGTLGTLTTALPGSLTTLRLGGSVTAGSALFGRMRIARAFGYALSDADFAAAATLGA